MKYFYPSDSYPFIYIICETDQFQPVSSSCMYWDFLDLYSNGETNMFHCILDEKTQLGIVYTRWKWVEQGSCPYYDRYSKQIHIQPCDTKLGSCPEKDFFSYQAVKYSACIQAYPSDVVNLNTKNSDVQAMRSSIMQVIQDANGHTIILHTISNALSVFLLMVLIGLHAREHFKGKKKKNKGNKADIMLEDALNQDRKSEGYSSIPVGT